MLTQREQGKALVLVREEDWGGDEDLGVAWEEDLLNKKGLPI